MSFVFTRMCLLLRDAASRRELLSVIAQLADSQPDILVTSLLHCLLNSGVITKSGEPRYHIITELPALEIFDFSPCPFIGLADAIYSYSSNSYEGKHTDIN